VNASLALTTVLGAGVSIVTGVAAYAIAAFADLTGLAGTTTVTAIALIRIKVGAELVEAAFLVAGAAILATTRTVPVDTFSSGPT
jgi:hypothetical protein